MEDRNTATLEFEFYPHEEGYPDIDLRFNIEPGFDIWTFKNYCMRFAAAMGYAEKSIEKAFGEEVWD